MSKQEDTYTELNSYTKFTSANIYEVPEANPAANSRLPQAKTKKYNTAIIFLIIATAVNFLLIIAVAVAFAYFEKQDNTSANAFTSQGSGAAIDNMGPPGPAGPPGPPGEAGTDAGGAIYTRWGKSSCPDTSGTQLFYSGYTGGSRYDIAGGGANLLCMPKTPEYSDAITYRGGENGYAYIWGTQYEQPIVGANEYNVPCAVCYVSTRPTVVMIPAKASCPPTWTREYYGYVMADWEHSGRGGRNMFECVDASQESSTQNTWGSIFHHVEAQCGAGGLPCPPYNNNQELNCVVCTK